MTNADLRNLTYREMLMWEDFARFDTLRAGLHKQLEQVQSQTAWSESASASIMKQQKHLLAQLRVLDMWFYERTYPETMVYPDLRKTNTDKTADANRARLTPKTPYRDEQLRNTEQREAQPLPNTMSMTPHPEYDNRARVDRPINPSSLRPK